MNNGIYLQDILNSVKDEPAVLRKLSKTIVRYSNMTEQELQDQIKGINNGLQQVEQEKQFVIDVYKSQDCSRLVDISDDGKVIRATGNYDLTIEDESLKEKIFAQLYFQEMQGSNDKFAEKVSDFYRDGKTDFKFSKRVDTPLSRKKVFSAMKVTAREQGYVVLNSLEECESGDNIQIQVLEVQKGKPVSFKDLKSIYQKLDIFYKDDDYTKLYVKDRTTGKEIIDPQLQTMGRFAAIWAGAAGTKWTSDEEIRGISYAFNEPSERVFSKLGELVGKSMTEKGTIDTESIYKAISDDSYKHSEEIVRTLLSNSASMKIVYDFYKMQTDDAKMETISAKTTNEVVFGHSIDSSIEYKAEEILSAIPNLKPKPTRIQAQEQVARKSQTQIERNETDNDVQVRTEQQSYEEKRDSFRGNKKGLGMKAIKKDIFESKVSESEAKQQEKEIADLKYIKRLMFTQRTGGTLTDEQKRLIEEHNRQTNEVQVGFRNQQDKKKFQGIEM